MGESVSHEECSVEVAISIMFISCAVTVATVFQVMQKALLLSDTPSLFLGH
jgi:hypothetical protein